jgi:hypothetical protein
VVDQHPEPTCPDCRIRLEPIVLDGPTWSFGYPGRVWPGIPSAGRVEPWLCTRCRRVLFYAVLDVPASSPNPIHPHSADPEFVRSCDPRVVRSYEPKLARPTLGGGTEVTPAAAPEAKGSEISPGDPGAADEPG